MTDQLRPSSSASSSPASPSSSLSSAAPSLCSNQCGFYGSPKQDGMCSKCFKSIALKKAAEADAAAAALDSATSLAPAPSDLPSSALFATASSTSSSSSPAAATVSTAEPVTEDIPIFRSSVSASSLPPLSFSDSMSIPLTSPDASPQLTAAPAPSPQPATTPAPSACSAASSTSLSPPLSSLSLAAVSPSPAPLALAGLLPAAAAATTSASASDKKRKNRCLHCNVKVGLTFFSCRCNESAMFCATHRYPHSHQCTVDQRKQQQDKLTKANPVCAHDKLERI